MLPVDGLATPVGRPLEDWWICGGVGKGIHTWSSRLPQPRRRGTASFALAIVAH